MLRYPPQMNMDVDLERLVTELRRNSKDDVEFAQRVALVCAKRADRAAVD